VRFLDFGVDPDFSHCVDGLVLVDVQRLKPHKRDRYMPRREAEAETGAGVVTETATA
jgi:hypothetical protein